MATPGLRLIQDLFAKSVAKWSNVETTCIDESKRKRSVHDNNDEVVYRKKTKKDKQCKMIKETVLKTEDEKFKNKKIETNKIKVEYIETKHIFPDAKIESSRINVESTETNPVFHEAKIEARKIKKEYPELDIPKSQIKTPTNDRFKRKQVDAETEKFINKQKKERNELNDKNYKRENFDVVKIKNEFESEYTESNYTKKEVNKSQDSEKTTEYKSLIMALLKKSAAKYTGNKDDLEKVDKVGNKIEKKKNSKSDMLLKKEYTEYDTKTEITNKEEEAIEGKSYIMGLLKQSLAKYTENHDEGHNVREENIDKKDEKIKKRKIRRAKPILLKEENVEEFENDDSNPSKVYRKRETCKQVKAFSPEEDDILTSAMDTFGENISIRNLAKDLHRSWASIRDRVIKLKTGKRQKERRVFSLTEDLMIMDRVLESLPVKTLQEINLHNDGTSLEVATALGRKEVSPRNRWGNQLKPWILQHYSGTLNLNIRRMLANYLADTFDSLDSIDWLLVAQRPEFVGHTQGSLRSIFFAYLFRSTKIHQNLENTEITLKNIADNANVAYGEKNCRKVSENVLIRQKQVIDYFEQYVKKHGITNFL